MQIIYKNTDRKASAAGGCTSPTISSYLWPLTSPRAGLEAKPVTDYCCVGCPTHVTYLAIFTGFKLSVRAEVPVDMG